MNLDGTALLVHVLKNAVHLDGHSLNYDPENDVIWVTNPYGLDCVLQPAAQACQAFIDQVRAGGVYGSCPG